MRTRDLRRIQKAHLRSDGSLPTLHELRTQLSKTSPSGFKTSLPIKKPRRMLSGVTPVTVVTAPHPCPGRCIYCPSDIRAPKSYLSHEPGVQRAILSGFDPGLQVTNRLLALDAAGHDLSKIEIIVLGGTFTSYPKAYQVDFVSEIFHALNTFSKAKSKDRHDRSITQLDKTKIDLSSDYRDNYNAASPKVENTELEACTLKRLDERHKANEEAQSRCVGLSIETRPDHISAEQLVHLRSLGVTKIQIGLQHTDDTILKMNKRDHSHLESTAAIQLLKRFGFKVQVHWMPNLYGSTPARDISGYRDLHSPKGCLPDEIKIYPCVLLPKTELAQINEAGDWNAYSDADLQKVLTCHLEDTPRWTRISRMVRDIDHRHALKNPLKNNLRETIEESIRLKGGTIQEIKSREIREFSLQEITFCLQQHQIQTQSGREIFLEATDTNQNLLGFLRLFLPGIPAPIDELRQTALIREVHVYGPPRGFSPSTTYTSAYTQHRGIGQNLIKWAEQIAERSNFNRISVISAIGTRSYYQKLGYHLGRLYQHKALPHDVAQFKYSLSPTRGT